MRSASIGQLAIEIAREVEIETVNTKGVKQFLLPSLRAKRYFWLAAGLTANHKRTFPLWYRDLSRYIKGGHEQLGARFLVQSVGPCFDWRYKWYCTTNFRAGNIHIVWYGGPAGAAGLSLNPTLILS